MAERLRSLRIALTGVVHLLICACSSASSPTKDSENANPAAKATAPATAHSGVMLQGCSPRLLEFVEIPARHALLQLERISCVPFSSSPFSTGEALVSPDGEAVARWHGGSPAPIEASSLAGARLVEVPNRVTFRTLGSSLGFPSGPDTLAWATNSRSLWTVRQNTASPSGFALTGLVPVRLGLDGETMDSPPLLHAAGPLDGLQWLGGNGLALALFGGRGNYYRPEHEDSSPTLAIVDAAHGQVRASLPASRDPDLAARARAGAFSVTLSAAAATVLPDGRVRAVIQFGPWADRKAPTPDEKATKTALNPGYRMVWTEGETPVRLPETIGDRREMGPIALTRNGSSLLMVKPLQPLGVRVFDCRDCPPPPPPKPVKGPLAELLDVETGRLIWRLTVEVGEFWSQTVAPAISADGRYAVVELPPRDGRARIGLISMTDGRIVQSFSAVAVGSYRQSLGFSPDGQKVWLVSGNTVFTYHLDKERRQATDKPPRALSAISFG